MATLTLSPAGAFVWEGTAEEARPHAEVLAGFTRTTMAPPGRLRYYTSDYEARPLYNPWAALPLLDAADAAASVRLAPLAATYRASFTLTGPADVAPMPKGEALLPFQAGGVQYALARDHAVIGDPMGLGKSIQAMAVANAVEARRILIICPANVLLQWRDFARRWLVPLGRPVSTFVIAGADYGVHPAARVVIVSYDRARGPIHARLLEHEWDLIVLDEAHYLRNHDARRTRAVLGGYTDKAPPGIITRGRRVVALTGTPLPNRPRECYTLTRALDHEAIGWMSEDAFKDRYNASTMVWTQGEGKGGEKLQRPYVIERTGRLPELNARLRTSLLVRREKDKAAPQLPAKRYSIVPLGSRETDEVVAAERLLDIDPENLDHVPMDKQGHIAALRRQMGIAMLPLAIEYIRNILDAEPDPLVLFAYHREVISGLADKLASYRPVVVTGSTSPVARREHARQFAEDPRIRLFIGQLTAAGTGIDRLQERASTALFVEPSWVPGENEQCVDRLHRLGQGRPVHAGFMVAPESWNERILQRAIQKLRVAHVTLDAPVVAV